MYPWQTNKKNASFIAHAVKEVEKDVYYQLAADVLI